jgi:lipopolysaccharide export system protein LptC
MSELADQLRAARRGWAATGSSHDRLIAASRIALPAAIGVLVAFLAVAPLTVGRDISFVLSKDRVDVARERMRVTEARYTGQDGKGQPFALDAASAVQQSSRDPIVQLQRLDARIALADGPATIRAPRGRYDLDSERVAIDGPVRFDGSGGYRVDTRDVLVDMKTRRVVSRGAVDGAMPLGRFAAQRMQADLDAHVVRLDGRARLHIVQGRGRGAR